MEEMKSQERDEAKALVSRVRHKAKVAIVRAKGGNFTFDRRRATIQRFAQLADQLVQT